MWMCGLSDTASSYYPKPEKQARGLRAEDGPWPSVHSPLLWPQVVMKVVQLLPDGHRVKKEVDAALDTVSETMTPMHYHLREIIICTYRQVRACM